MIAGNYRWQVLEGKNVENARLDGSDFTGANLKGANLNGASLKGASLALADLRGASLQGTDLTGADLSGACLDSTTRVAAIGEEPWETFIEKDEDWTRLHSICHRLEKRELSEEEAAGEIKSRSDVTGLLYLAQEIKATNLQRALYERALEIAPEKIESRRMLARLSSPLEAIQLLSDYAKEDMGAAAELGFYLALEGRLPEAIPHLEKAIQGGYPDQSPYFVRAQIHLNQGHLNEAKALLEHAHVLSPSDSAVNLLLAKLCLGPVQDRETAHKCLSSIMEHGESNIQLQQDTILLLIMMGRFNAALAEIERIPQWGMEPSARIGINRLKATALCGLGRAQLALDALGDDPGAPFLRARALQCEGHTKESWLSQAEAAAPSLELADWLRDAAEPQAALNVLKKLPQDITTLSREFIILQNTDSEAAAIRLEKLKLLPGGHIDADKLARKDPDAESRARARHILNGLTQKMEVPAAMFIPGVRLEQPFLPIVQNGGLMLARHSRGDCLVTYQPSPPTSWKAQGWKPVSEHGQATVWRPPFPSSLRSNRQPEDDSALRDYLASCTANEAWPPLRLGLTAYLHQLLGTDAPNHIKARMGDVANTLKDGFGLNNEAMQHLEQGTVVDGYGPSLLVPFSGRWIVVPCGPEPAKGPLVWNQIQWHIAAHLDEGALFGEHRLKRPLPPEATCLISDGLVYLAIMQRYAVLSRYQDQHIETLWRVMSLISRGLPLRDSLP